MNLLDIICRPNNLDPCCPSMLHLCIRINIPNEPNPTHTHLCTHMPMFMQLVICMYAHAHARKPPMTHHCAPMERSMKNKTQKKSSSIKSFFFVLLPMSCHHLHFTFTTPPLVFSTMPTFCTFNPPSFHICFVFLVSHACFGEDYLTCGPFSLDMCLSITGSHLSHTMEIMVVAMMVKMTREGSRLGGTRLT